MQPIARQVQKRLASRLATRGDRQNIERLFYIEALPLIARWYDRIRTTFIESGTLERSYIQARVLGSADIPKSQAKLFVESAVRDITEDSSARLLDDSMGRDLVKFLRRWKKRVYDIGAVSALRMMGFQAEGEFTQMKAESPMNFRLLDQQTMMNLDMAALQSVSYVQATTIRQARNVIRDTIYLQGKTIDDAAKVLGTMTLKSKAEALKIVRTESQVAFGAACQDVYEKSGVTEKEWWTVGDHRVRHPHSINEAQGPIPMNGVFASGQSHPGDPGPGVLHINCRCSLIPVVRNRKSLNPWNGA